VTDHNHNLEDSDSEELRPSISDRGFAHWPVVESDYGAEILVYESSAVNGPFFWISIDQPEIQGFAGSITATHITLEQAWQLRDTLDAAIEKSFRDA